MNKYRIQVKVELVECNDDSTENDIQQPKKMAIEADR
jgi:hypothetical protein